MAGELLLEIGTEEIPSDYLGEGLKAFRRLAESTLKENRINWSEGFYTHGTPRRLILIGEGIADKQDDVWQEVTGPPKKVAYDEKGNPTKAALGFAKKQGVSVDELGFLETPKGEYLHVKRKIPGKHTIEILAEMLPKLIAQIPWPKSMFWGDVGFSFVRPIHWVLALFDSVVIPFEVADIKSGNKTRGHRFMAPQISEVDSVQAFFRKMEECSVIVDREKRRSEVKKAVTEAASDVSGKPIADSELLTTVTNLVEFPSAICGSFDKAFLNLPAPVLITAMKEHQKYFAVYDQAGLLMPNFVAVNNTLARDESIVQKGHERVLRARLADANFFFNEDSKRRLEDRLEDLKDVIYQSELGTSFAKVERFTRLAEDLSKQIAPEKQKDVTLTGRLCKCDLVTEMVMEFPSLQGVMGREYARLDGYLEDICVAIHEHYLPLRAEDELPDSIMGAIVGLADRMDTIAGCFAIQLEPTGATDPFALRRHALAIIRILEKMQWDISLKGFINGSLDILNEEIDFDKNQVMNRVLVFFRERYRNMILRGGYETDLIEAILSVEFDHVSQLRLRIDQLQRFTKESSEFESLVQTYKRINNILKNQKKSSDVDSSLFKDPCESALWRAYQEFKDDVYGLMEKKNYFEALNLMVRLRKPVDDLFDGVEILTKDDPRVRENRVGMLQNLAQLFLSLADFSKFSI